MPDWDNTESRERDEDAAWRDLVARFDAPLTGQQPVPWPDREDMPAEPVRETDGASGTDGVHGGDGERGADGAYGVDGAHAAGGEYGADGAHGGGGDYGADGAHGGSGDYGADGRHRGTAAGGLDGEHGRHAADGEHGRHAADAEPGRHAAGGEHGLAGPNGKHGSDGPGDRASGLTGGVPGRHGRLSADGAYDPEVIQVPRRIRGPVTRGVPPVDTPEDNEHYIPPAPPPLPKLDPVAKGAWVALFGGPGYLMVATVAGWSVSGLAAFCAVAAFVAGFAILVLRMHEPGPGGPDDGDDGAVV